MSPGDVRIVGSLKLRLDGGRLCGRGKASLGSTMMDFKNFYSNIIMSPSKLIFAGRRYKFNGVRTLTAPRGSVLGGNFITGARASRLPTPKLCIHVLRRAGSMAGRIGGRVSGCVGGRRTRVTALNRGTQRGVHHTYLSSVYLSVRGGCTGGCPRLIYRMDPCCANGTFCLGACGRCSSVHLIFTPPRDLNGFNNRASG